MEKNSKIYVAGHTGLAGSALVKVLQTQGYNNLIFKTHKELDEAIKFFSKKPKDVRQSESSERN